MSAMHTDTVSQMSCVSSMHVEGTKEEERGEGGGEGGRGGRGGPKRAERMMLPGSPKCPAQFHDIPW